MVSEDLNSSIFSDDEGNYWTIVNTAKKRSQRFNNTVMVSEDLVFSSSLFRRRRKLYGGSPIIKRILILADGAFY